MRSLRAPDQEIWAGSTAVPASVEAHALEDGLVVLGAGDGTVYRFDPRADEVVRIDRIGRGAAWMADGSSGLFLDVAGKAVLQISTGGNWRYGVRDSVLWAAPVERDAIALLVGSEGGRELWILREGESRPAERLTVSVGPPGLVTAWGSRLVFPGVGDSAGRLRVLTVAPLGAGMEISIGREVDVLLASPSSHEIYAVVDSPPGIVAVSRFTGASRTLASPSRRPLEARVGLFGESILFTDGTEVFRVPVTGGEPARLDMEWGVDLPIGLPDGRVLGAREGNLLLVDSDAGSEIVLGEATANWWLPVRWNPDTGGVVADRLRGERITEEVGEGAEIGSEPVDSGAAALDASGSGAPERSPEFEEGRRGDVAPGFYAIVGSARSVAGIGALVRSLDLAGYRTAIQRFLDDAGQVWHRGLVGPYRSRTEAEAAARQLERERRLQTWVTEITDLEPRDGAR